MECGSGLQAKGYQGEVTLVRDYIRPKRPPAGESGFETEPGRQIQNDWGEIFNDQVLATAILDRLLAMHHIEYYKGESYRLKGKRKAGPFGPPPKAQEVRPDEEEDA